MPFPSALSTANQTTKRNGIQSAIRYSARLVPTVQMQLNPSANASGASGASISYSAVLQGGTSSVLTGMTVYITPSSDYRSDLINKPEACLRTYIRKAPTSDTVYIGWTAFQWTTASYVTIVDNFEPHLKKTRVVGTTIYKNVDIPHRNPLPRITDFYATVTLTTTGSANVSPTPTFTAMDSGASISSYSWATIVNGTVTTGVSTSATPTFNLATGIHWLYVTVMDSFGNTNWFAVLTVVVSENYDSVVDALLIGDVVNDLAGGIQASVTTEKTLTDDIPASAAIVFDDIIYKDNTREQVVKCFGWLDADVQQEIVADSISGIRLGYSTAIHGIRPMTEHLRMPAYPFRFASNPNEWGEVSRCTVYDSIWYAISEHSTIANVAAVDFPSDYTDYQYNPGIQVPEGTVFDTLDQLAFFASGALINYSPHGELFFRQSLIYAPSSSDRDAATVYATYTTGDGSATRINRPPLNKFPLSAIQAGFATFNTTTNKPRIYNSLAPANETPTALLETLDSVIMTKNLSDANANTEAGKLAINHYFASVQTTSVIADFIAGYTTLEASSHQWHKFSIASTETLDGQSFDSNTRLLCTQVSSSYDVNTWGIVVAAQFREETDGGDNYSRETKFVPLDTTQAFPTYPNGNYSPFLDDFENPSDVYGSDFDEQREGWEDPTLPPELAPEESAPGANVIDTVYVPFRGGAINSNFTSVLNDTYIVQVTGVASIGGDGWCETFDFRDSEHSFEQVETGDRDDVTWTNGSGYEGAGASPGKSVNVRRDFETDASGQSITYTVTFDNSNIPDDDWRYKLLTYSGALLVQVSADSSQSTQTLVATSTEGLWIFADDRSVANNRTYPGYFQQVKAEGLGSNPFNINPCSSAGNLQGDAFFEGFQDDGTPTAYTGQGGLNLDGSGIVHANDYSSEHVYEFTVTGTGNVFAWSFTDNDGDYAENENKYIQVTISQ